MVSCSGRSNEKWKHQKGGPIVHVDSGLCLDITEVKPWGNPVLNECSTNKTEQNWQFKTYHTNK